MRLPLPTTSPSPLLPFVITTIFEDGRSFLNGSATRGEAGGPSVRSATVTAGVTTTIFFVAVATSPPPPPHPPPQLLSLSPQTVRETAGGVRDEA